MTNTTTPNPLPDLVAAIRRDPRIDQAFRTFERDGKVSVAQIEPVIGDTILKAMQQADMLDGRDDDRISRRTVERVYNSMDRRGMTPEMQAQARSAIAAIPADGIRLHPENVNGVVSRALRRADANDDWQIGGSELMDLVQLIGQGSGDLVERPSVPARTEPRRR